MTKLIEKPYLAFFYAFPILILLALINGDRTIDIQLHDTYFVFGPGFFLFFNMLLFSILGLGYWLCQRLSLNLYRSLSIVHISITIFGSIIIWSAFLLFPIIPKSPISFEEFENMTDFLFYERVNFLIFITVVGTYISQAIFLVNILMSLLLRRTN